MVGGERPDDLAARAPRGSYLFRTPIERSGLIFAEVRYQTGRKPFEGYLTPAADILSLHRKTFEGRAWSEGRLIHEGAIAAGSLSLVKAGVRSDVRLLGDIDIVQVFLPHATVGAIAAELYGRPVHLTMDGWVVDPTLAELVIRTLARLDAKNPEDVLASETLALSVAEHLVRQHGSRSGIGTDFPVRRGGLAPWQLNRLLEYMDANLGSETQLQDLASQVGLSPFHFIRVFRAETGTTPHQWLVRRRISQAKALLSGSDLSIASVATTIGYASQSAMTTVFSRLVGLTPKQWRART